MRRVADDTNQPPLAAAHAIRTELTWAGGTATEAIRAPTAQASRWPQLEGITPVRTNPNCRRCTEPDRR